MTNGARPSRLLMSKKIWTKLAWGIAITLLVIVVVLHLTGVFRPPHR